MSLQEPAPAVDGPPPGSSHQAPITPQRSISLAVRPGVVSQGPLNFLLISLSFQQRIVAPASPGPSSTPWTISDPEEWVDLCYTLNTTGSEFGYGPGRKVSETRHTVLGRHPKTGQPVLSGLGSGQPTLRHQEVPRPSTGADRECASAAAEEDNLGGHHKDEQ